jgi:endoglucanase
MNRFAAAALSLCASWTWALDAAPLARLSQAGFEPVSAKIVVMPRQLDGTFRSGDWMLVSMAGKSIKPIRTGHIPSPSYWNAIADSAQSIALPAVLPEGVYRLTQGKDRLSPDFEVRSGRNAKLLRLGMKAYYHNRASTATDSAFAGKWARPAGHPDTLVNRHVSTGQTGTLSAPMGWYDAGDYGKYIVNSGVSCWLLLDLYENAPAIFDTLKWGIPHGPEPELLREIKWNLDWMLAMQDADGGVYHKLTSLKFNPMNELPHQDLLHRFVVMKTTAASLDFTLVLAKAARIWRAHDTAYANLCLRAARRSWAWSVANPEVLYKQPSDVRTGKYEDNHVSDERFAAAAELALATSDSDLFRPFREQIPQRGAVSSWQEVGALGVYTILSHPTFFAVEQAAAKAVLTDSATKLRDRVRRTGYATPIDSADFVWGSNAVECMQGIHMAQAFAATGDSSFLEGAEAALDYVLGKNPIDSSYVTGVGIRQPRHPHHRPSASDTVDAPVPGFLVGGPHPGGQDIGPNPWQLKDYRVTGKPALDWVDDTKSYASNEVAINWNAAMVHLAGRIAIGRKSLR